MACCNSSSYKELPHIAVSRFTQKFKCFLGCLQPCLHHIKNICIQKLFHMAEIHNRNTHKQIIRHRYSIMTNAL